MKTGELTSNNTYGHTFSRVNITVAGADANLAEIVRPVTGHVIVQMYMMAYSAAIELTEPPCK